VKAHHAAGLGIVVLVGALAGCSGGDDDEPAIGSTLAPTPETIPALPAPAGETGTGLVVIGGTTSTFAISACRVEPDPTEPEGARVLASLTGAGTTESGVPFTVEAQRFSTGTGAATTFTDTVTYSDSGRILQAQRIEVAGQVDDLRDPEATTPLLRTRSDGLSAAGLAGAPGDGADDEGIVGLAVQATC
jgi:hypothetical protein